MNNIVGENLQWKILNNEGNNDDEEQQNKSALNDEEILDFSYTYINNNPVGVHLIKKGDNYKLKVNPSFQFFT